MAVKMIETPAAFIQQAYSVLYRFYGPQKWWPARTPFEIVIGAILTQNTNWTNVEQAIGNLRRARATHFSGLRRLSPLDLAEQIRPSGYFNSKARTLIQVMDYLDRSCRGQLRVLKKRPLAELRSEWLAIKGIGPETADAILLYALEKPVFVVDAYTRRLMVAHGVVEERIGYHDLQSLFMESLPEDVVMYNEYHALIVRCAKDHYRRHQKSLDSPLHQLRYQAGGGS